MGPVIRKLLVLSAAAALVASTPASATTTTYRAPFQAGPTGGDEFNHVETDPATGRVTVLRVNPVPTNGGLGCGGFAGFGALAVSHTATSALQNVVVTFEEALIDPYTFVNVGVRKGDRFLNSRVTQGPLIGSGTVTVDLAHTAATGPITVWFGLETSGACPNVDGGTARFTSVAVTEA